MGCAAARPAKARGGKSPPERWLVNGVCCRAHASSKNHSYIMDSTTVGRAPKAPAPLLWRRPKAASIMVDGEIDGAIYGTTYE